MAYITETILEEAHGAALVAELTDSDANTLARLIGFASARVRTWLQVGGYTAAVPETVYDSNASDCPTEIVELTSRVWKQIAFTRKNLSIPQDQIDLLEKIQKQVEAGDYEIKGVARSVVRAPGGISRSESSLAVTVANGSRPQIFSRKRMYGS